MDFDNTTGVTPEEKSSTGTALLNTLNGLPEDSFYTNSETGEKYISTNTIRQITSVFNRMASLYHMTGVSTDALVSQMLGAYTGLVVHSDHDGARDKEFCEGLDNMLASL